MIKVKSASKQTRICIVRQDYHPGDSRIENQAQSLVENGFSVDLICMRRPHEPWTALSNGIRIIRLPALNRLRGNILVYLLEYAVIWLAAFFALTTLHLWRRYSLVQVCNLPDFLLFTALVPKLTGSKILFDFRECMPEMYAAKYNVSMESRPIRLLSSLEQACVRFSDGAVTCTEQMRQATIARGTPPNKIIVMMNSVDSAKFHERQLPDLTAPIGEAFNIITHGSIIPRYGHETLLRAMDIVRQEAPEARLRILGRGQQSATVEALSHSLNLDEVVHFVGFAPFAELLMHLRWAHVGAVTMVRNQETDLIHTLKMQEYMVLGIPVAISRTSAVEAYFGDESVQFFTANDPEDLAKALLRLRNNPDLRHRLATNAAEQCRLYSTASQKRLFAHNVRELIGQTDKSPVEILQKATEQ